MKARSLRLVLAFYSAEEGHSESAWKSLKARGGSCLIGPDANSGPESSCRRYEGLRLEGESLLVVETAPSEIETVVNNLRQEGSPAIFVVRPDFGVAISQEDGSSERTPDGADQFQPAPHDQTRRAILARLQSDERDLEEARCDLMEGTRLDHALTPAAEWILDNTYLIRTQIAEVRRHLPRDHSSWATSYGRPGGVSALARELTAATDRTINANNIREALRDNQKSNPLTIAELWAFPLFLRIALIETLTRLAIRVSHAQQLRESAYLWANRLANGARLGDDVFGKILARLEGEPVAQQAYFVTALAEQLQDEETALGPAQHWIEERFGKSLVDVVRAQHNREAAEVVSTANAFGSLRTLSQIDFTKIFEEVSLVEAELRLDPSGVYESSDFRTRDRCRRAVETIAGYSGAQEIDIARAAVRLAAQSSDPRNSYVAYFLLAQGIPLLEAEVNARIPRGTKLLRSVRRHATSFYLTAIIGLTCCFTVLACILAWEGGVVSYLVLAALAVLAAFPLSELSIQIVNALVISLLPPSPLPKMDYTKGIPGDHTTLVVVPIMLSGVEVIRSELEKLEVRYLGNRDENLFFSLFPDFTDAAESSVPGDEELLKAAKDGIDSLNSRYPGERFLLFHRSRVWSASEGKWIGRERKRGKLEELNAFLCGAGHQEILIAGHLPRPVAFVITLDSDTQLPAESARRLVETISHPLNKVEIDAETRVRKSGYTIIQPRVSITLPGATATRFTRVFADATGTDPYCQTVSDAQQDLFLEAIFHGKAIYDVRAFFAIAGGRFPPETLLSHDLIEGAHVGVGLATDIELFEHLPVNYGSFAMRQHRWIRGDWQIARWVFRSAPNAAGNQERNPLTLINRWRIFDNLRRSLVPVAALALLLLGWLVSHAPGVWSLVVGLAVAIPAFAPLLDRVVRRIQGSVHRWQGAADELVRAIVMIAFLPHQAWLAADAIVRVLYRRYVSHRRMLEWETAERAKAESRRHMDATWRQMLAISGLSLVLTIVLLLERAFAPSSMFIALWVLSPPLMRWLAQPVPLPGRRELKPEENLFLRGLARHTWRYFDDLVGPESNWLPPDNSQLALRVEVAKRTSPTNIGFWLTSLLAARDFGYVTTEEFCRRCSLTLETIGRMEHYEGHLLNWYETTTLAPLAPRYISTVDSGNLIAALWVVEQGCAETIHAPLLGQRAVHGLSDTLAVFGQAWGDDPAANVPLQALRRLLHGAGKGHQLIARFRIAAGPMQKLRETQRWSAPKKGSEPKDERSYWAWRLAGEFGAWIDLADRYLRWMETLALAPDANLRAAARDTVRLRRRALAHMPSLATLASGAETAMDRFLQSLQMARSARELPPEISEWLDQLTAEYSSARTNAAATVASIHALAATAAKIADGVNMGFLYDADRRLFGVGYAVGGPREFSSHYDLLGSECRLASLVAIAKGDVPMEHWFSLARPYSRTKAGAALLSWSGTMFEYLMPVLFTRTYANSMLEGACRDAVQRQIEYAAQHRIPWGISECAYSAIDSHQIYQYRAFGVPALALNPGLQDALVVAPYAAVLALMIDPAAAIADLRRLGSMGLTGPMGFYESIDFTRESKRNGVPGVVIYSYMAHHQGMSLAALDNVVHRYVLQRRFHADLRIRSVESLLFERNPITRLPKEEEKTRLAPIRIASDEEAADRTWTEETASPRVFLHGNGRYALMTTNSGGGYSRWNDFDVTRWRSDPTLDPWGTFIYVRDLRSDEIWATTHKPFTHRQGESAVRFAADRAELRRRVSGIETVLEVTVAAEDDAELRRLRITNRSLRTRQLEFTSYIELAMASHGADKAHPAFAKMFVETEYPEDGVLLAHRRPRSPGEPPIWTGHILTGATDGIQYETDRAKFLGRGNGPDNPAALQTGLSGSVGTVIDPIFSLRCRLTLDARDRHELTFVVVAAASRQAVMDLVHKYTRPDSVARAFEMAWTQAQLEFRFLRIGAGAAHQFQELASQLLYPSQRLRPPVDRLVRNRLGQKDLWAYGISGDLPMLVVTVTDSRHLPLVREVLSAHAYWRLRGFKADLIILNQEGPAYDQPLRQELLRQIEAHTSDAGMDKPGGVFLRDWHSMPEEHRNLMLAVAGIVLNGNRGGLQQQLAAAGEAVPLAPFVPPDGGEEEPSQPLPFLELPYFNGLGGFTPDGREYAIYLKPGATTPAPWVNVMAGPDFGTMVSESGLGFTWFGNSQTNRLTPWHNDPVTDPQSEAIYLRDDDSGAVWTPTALPARETDAYRARHGHGYTVFEHNSHAIGQELTVFVPVHADGTADPVKICRLHLRNDSSHHRRITVTWCAGWVLGSIREDQQLHVQTSHDDESGAVLARQFWNGAYPGQFAFAASSPRADSWSGDRTQFFGRNGSVAAPAALDRVRLDNRSGQGSDPAGALQVTVTLDPGRQSDVIFLLGQADSIEKVHEYVAKYRDSDAVHSALSETREWWASVLGTIQVRTPVLSTDLMLNGWLLYQTLSCRFWGRSALYQSGGALGFRDQLQDCLAFVYAAPQITRRHILTAAARQFLEGDVQHWWHPESGVGVRTRCSDDLLWLPFVVAHYIKVTGDTSILEESVPFLEAPLLAEGEQERMFEPTISAQTASIWEHCRRALDHGWRLGPHRLPLFGNGDWNDGMNLVGEKGRGESVWLGWFLCSVLESISQLMENRSEGSHLVAGWRQKAAQLKAALESTAWDGEWYLRGFFDNGSPLGSHANPEARIDSLPQSWAVISGAGDASKARQAMKSAQRLLVKERDELVLLFDPPFDHSEPNPGYIMGYPPGMRENGGQYTHGALWLAMAWARLRDNGRAAELLQMMNPIELTRRPEDVARYHGEPYVVAADVSSTPGRVGRAGWTWYTGSAGWMYRIWLEELLGLRVRGDHFTVEPAIPDDWDGFTLTWRHRGTVYEIEVLRGESPTRELIPLVENGGTVRITVIVPKPNAPAPAVIETEATPVSA